MRSEEALVLIIKEYKRASNIHGPFKSAHEGYAIMLEEFDELWDEIKQREPNVYSMEEEVVQIGAMALRFLVDICGDPTYAVPEND